MVSVVPNRGKFNWLGIVYRNASAPANFFAPLFTNAITPTVDTNIVGDLTQIATGNGYADGGPSVARSAVGFDVLTEDDTNDRAFIQMADVLFVASGGNLPSSGDGASFMGLSDDNGTVASRDLFAVFDLTAARTVSDGQTLTIQDAEQRVNT